MNKIILYWLAGFINYLIYIKALINIINAFVWSIFRYWVIYLSAQLCLYYGIEQSVYILNLEALSKFADVSHKGIWLRLENKKEKCGKLILL